MGYRVSEMGTTCMATEGGVACLGTLAGQTQGFQVSPAGTTTFGGTDVAEPVPDAPAATTMETGQPR